MYLCTYKEEPTHRLLLRRVWHILLRTVTRSKSVLRIISLLTAAIDANIPRQHGDVYNTKETKFKVYYNDGVNSPAIVFEARTVTDYKDWIAEQLKGKTPVNNEFPCTEDVMRSASTFCYEVYNGENDYWKRRIIYIQRLLLFVWFLLHKLIALWLKLSMLRTSTELIPKDW